LSIVLTGYLIVFLRRRIASSSMKMGAFSQKVENNMILFIKVILILWWFKIVTKSLGIHSHLVSLKDTLMLLSWEIGDISISLLSVFDFLFIVLGTWFIVKLVNVILEVEVFARFKFPRGIPTAITTVSNYMINISGTFMSLSSLGVTSEQFTLVLGALGVGIGFGLRNIIANFISGIIMVFERPIQIGDTIEINNTMGKVDGIGTRSSRIKTFDGSEVIIPNADFISKEITNWTLSDERRRKTLQFKVALDSDIQEVLSLMSTIINAHANVLQDPKALATFVGFGEYYLEFKAYYWLDENLVMAESDITIGIYEALKNKGIKMPLPKQVLLKEEEN
jgi:small-conductance mechanosensitive channel